MSELIKLQSNNLQEQSISARELYDKLGLSKDFSNWFKYQSDKLNLIENQDFTPILAKSTGGRPGIDYLIPLDIAKHITMISGGEKAREIRNYFIQVERAWNSPEKVMARALEFAKMELAHATKQIESMKPKAFFAAAVSSSKSSVLVGDLAKLLMQNGYNTGANRLFLWMRENGYLIKRKGTDFNMPTQKSMELGLFEIKETAIAHGDGHITISKTPKVTGKGQQYFVNKLLG